MRGGALDMRALGVLFAKPVLLAMDLGVFAAAACLGVLRYRALLGLVGVRYPFLRLLQLHFVALFFNVVIPGNVGGDVLKGLYVARDAAPEKRTTILLIVFIERLMGLAGLVAMAALIALARGSAVWADPLLRPLASTVVLLAAATLLGPALLVVLMRAAGDRLEAYTTGTTSIAKLAGRLVAAVRLLASGPRSLVLALLFSMSLHALAMAFFTVLTSVMGPYDVSVAQIATVFPLGILTMILPISPSGLGVGHVAFDKLFAAIGLTGGATGATIFNVYLLGQIVPCLLGVFPYLALKRSSALPVDENDSRA